MNKEKIFYFIYGVYEAWGMGIKVDNEGAHHVFSIFTAFFAAVASLAMVIYLPTLTVLGLFLVIYLIGLMFGSLHKSIVFVISWLLLPNIIFLALKGIILFTL